MNVEQCRALRLIPYAVYGGKVESFKLRESQPDSYGDPMLLIVLDSLIVKAEAHTALEQELQDERGKHLSLWSKVAAVARRLMPEDESFNSDDAIVALIEAVSELENVRAYLDLPPEGSVVQALEIIEAEGEKLRKRDKVELDAIKAQIAAGEPFDADEIEAMRESQCKSCKLRHGPCVHDEERDISPIQDCTLYERKLEIDYDALSTYKEHETEFNAAADNIKLPSFDNNGSWVDQMVAVAKRNIKLDPVDRFAEAVPPTPEKDCGTCAMEKTCCPCPVSGKMTDCVYWQAPKTPSIEQVRSSFARAVGKESCGQCEGVNDPSRCAGCFTYSKYKPRGEE